MKTAMRVLVAMGLAVAAASRGAADAPPTAHEVRALMNKPLTAETWPRWRDAYVRLYYAYEVGEPPEFYEQIGRFVGAMASQNEGALPGEWGADPVAWIALSHHFQRNVLAWWEPTERTSRKAFAVGDPAGMSSYRLAHTLIAIVQHQAKPGELTAESRQKLEEAEHLLETVERVAPQARLSYPRGQIARLRGDLSAALPLLRQGAIDHPHSGQYAALYLTHWLASKEGASPFAATTEPFARQFPQDAWVQAVHALALYKDARYPEAYETFQQARRLDAKVVPFVGPDAVAAMEEGRWMTSTVTAGLSLFEDGLHGEAAAKFRQALREDAENVWAGRFLVRALFAHAHAHRYGADSAEASALLEECDALCRQFPYEPELHVAHAGALFRLGRSQEAADALEHAEALGGDVEKLAGRDGARTIRETARQDAFERIVRFTMLGGIVFSIAWVGVMFGMGALLAVCAPRTTNPVAVSEKPLVQRDVWLERFYLIVLSLSLLMFYLSVPFVALGLLAITLVLFGVMLAVRIIHFGVLYRGFFAVWGVLRSAFVGVSHDVLGLAATEGQHPRLFAALREAAQRLDTEPVETVYLTPGSSIGVYEQGTGPFGVLRRRRVMEIGVSTLSQLTTSEFKSILAHEYGHFTHQDPFYSRFIAQVTSSLAHSLAVMDAAGGFINYVNPFYWFYWLYLRAYVLLAAGFSRSREFLADRRAVLAYGRKPFVSGLTKSCVDGMLFEASAVRTINHELGSGRAFVNVYDAFRQFCDELQLAETQQQILQSLREAKPGWFDSHPTYSERLAAVNGLPDTRDALDDNPATSLLSELSSIEEQLTKLLTDYVSRAHAILPAPQ